MVLMSTAITAQLGNYMTTFAIDTLKVKPSIAQICITSGGLMIFVFSLLAGMLADKYGRKSIIVMATGGFNAADCADVLSVGKN